MTKKKILILTCGYPDAVNPNAHCFTHNQADCFVLSSYLESFGMVCAEAENRFGFNAFVKQIGKVYNEACKA